MSRLQRARTVNLPQHVEEAWSRLKATYPDQSFGGLVNRLLAQYLMKTGFLFEEEIPLKLRPRPTRMTGQVKQAPTPR